MVARDDDLREIIRWPVDTAAIQAEFEQLEAEKCNLGGEFDRLDSLNSRLPEFEDCRYCCASAMVPKSSLVIKSGSLASTELAPELAKKDRRALLT